MLGTCQCTDLCRFGVSDIASAGGIGHRPNGVTPGLNGITRHKIGLDGFACVSTASLASSSALGCSLDCHHLPTSHTLHRHMAPDNRIIQRNLTGASSGATGPPRQGRNNTQHVHVHGLPDTRLWVLGDQTDPIRCETYFHHCCVHRQRALSNPCSSVSKTALLTVLQMSTSLSTASRIQVHRSSDARLRNSL